MSRFMIPVIAGTVCLVMSVAREEAVSASAPYHPLQSKTLYQTNWHKGIDGKLGWVNAGAGTWTAAGGVLHYTSTGCGWTCDNVGRLIAPYHVRSGGSYALVARIRAFGVAPGGDPQDFGFTARAECSNPGNHVGAGYLEGSVGIWLSGADNPLNPADYTVNENYHTYRVEVRSGEYRLFIDGRLAAVSHTNQVLSGQCVGLQSEGVDMDISVFKVARL